MGRSTSLGTAGLGLPRLQTSSDQQCLLRFPEEAERHRHIACLAKLAASPETSGHVRGILLRFEFSHSLQHPLSLGGPIFDSYTGCLLSSSDVAFLMMKERSVKVFGSAGLQSKAKSSTCLLASREKRITLASAKNHSAHFTRDACKKT